MTGTDVPAGSLLADSAARFPGTMQALADDDLRAASALPDWTRAHVLTHVGQAQLPACISADPGYDVPVGAAASRADV
jgi:Mycothiol maleylpyruvate isomerase N-terminal domain